MRSALEVGTLPLSLGPLASDARFAGVTLLEADAARFWKKLAMPCCFGPGLADDELPVLVLGAARAFGVLTSLPSIPLAIVITGVSKATRNGRDVARGSQTGCRDAEEVELGRREVVTRP